MTVQNPGYQSSAYGFLAGLINTTPQDFCYSSMPSASSSGACARISNSTLRNACNETALTSNSTLSIQNATADCAYATSAPLKDLCYFSVYTSVALRTGNESWCGLIQNQSYLVSCVVNLANYTGNVTYCGSLKDSPSRQSCIYEIQLATGNYT